MPRVSVLMGVYNGGPWLGRAMEGALGQTYRDLELVVVDDASEDGSWEELNRWAESDRRVRLVRNQRNLGLTRSLARGLEMCGGELIARQDADDQSLPSRLELQVAELDARPELSMLGTGVIETDQHDRDLRVSLQPSLPAVIRRKMLFDNAFFHPSVMWRRRQWEDAGLAYDRSLRYGQDYELFSRAVWRVKVGNLRLPLVRFRAHPGQTSKSRVEGQQEVADRVAWSNFRAMGLDGEFSAEQVALMRRLGIRSGRLSTDQRRRQWRLWRRLFRRLESGLAPAERGQWREVKRARLGLLRRGLASSPALAPELAACLATDPADALRDLALVAARRLGRGAG